MRAVNLIPADQRQSGIDLTGRSGGAALIVLALLAGLAIMAGLYGSARHGESASRGELVTVDAELSAARAQVGRMAPYTGFIAMADTRVQQLGQLVASRFDWSHAFDELGRVLPRDTTLTTLHGQVGSGTGSTSSAPAAASATSAAGGAASASATSATPPGSTPAFSITGCASSQSEVAQTLQRLRLIDGVTEVTLQNSTKAARTSASSGAGSSSSTSGECGGATFSAEIVFAALPSAPPTNAPAAGASTVASTGGAR